MRIKLSQSDWQKIGEEMGWTKKANAKLDIPITGQVLIAMQKAISYSTGVDTYLITIEDDAYFESGNGEARIASAFKKNGEEDFKVWKVTEPDKIKLAEEAAAKKDYVGLIDIIIGKGRNTAYAVNKDSGDRRRLEEIHSYMQNAQNMR